MIKLWIMKIMYENCAVKNYMKEDHRSYRCNFCSCEKKAWKTSGLYGIRTFDLLQFVPTLVFMAALAKKPAWLWWRVLRGHAH